MSLRLKIPLHGRSHLQNGSDPIPGLGAFIRYVFHNIGEWLSVETTGSDARGVGTWPKAANFNGPGQDFLDVGNGILLRSGDGSGGFTQRCEWMIKSGQIIYYLDGGSDYGYLQGGDLLRYSGGGNIIFYTTDGGIAGAGDFNVYTNGSSDNVAGDIFLDASGGDDAGTFEVDAGSGITLKTYNGTIDMQALGTSAVSIRIGNGATFTILDHNGNPKIRWTEGTNDLHIPTSGTIVADL